MLREQGVNGADIIQQGIPLFRPLANTTGMSCCKHGMAKKLQ